MTGLGGRLFIKKILSAQKKPGRVLDSMKPNCVSFMEKLFAKQEAVFHVEKGKRIDSSIWG